jgi:hypothetical protein
MTTRNYVIPAGGLAGAYVTETSIKDYALPAPIFVSETVPPVQVTVQYQYSQNILMTGP